MTFYKFKKFFDINIFSYFLQIYMCIDCHIDTYYCIYKLISIIE